MHQRTDGVDQREGFYPRFYDQKSPGVHAGQLRLRPVRDHGHLAHEPLHPGIADDTDDREPNVPASIEAIRDAAANRILRGPHTSREGFTHDRHLKGSPGVTHVERTAAHDPHAHGLEEVEGRRPVIAVRPTNTLQIGSVLHRHRALIATVPNGKPVRDRRRPDPRQGSRPDNQLVEEQPRDVRGHLLRSRQHVLSCVQATSK